VSYVHGRPPVQYILYLIYTKKKKKNGGKTEKKRRKKQQEIRRRIRANTRFALTITAGYHSRVLF